MRLHLPPHIGWPLLVVMLLSISITASVYTYVAANSGGGAQVIDRYYERALHWNDEAVLRHRAEELGWTLDVQVTSDGSDALRRTVMTVRDSTGAGVGGLTGTVRLYRPHLAGAKAEIPLSPREDEVGSFAQLLPIDAGGLWDFELRLRQGDQSGVVMHVRLELE